MVKVYSSADTLMVGYVRSVLEEHGIDCIARNELLAGGAGALPINECWPELWVCSDADSYRARVLIRTLLAGGVRHDVAWVCDRCHERMEPQFSECWNCAAEGGGP